MARLSVLPASARADRRLADLAGAPTPQIHRLYRDDLVTLARQPLFAELLEMLYSNEQPHVLDSTQTQAVLGIQPTPLATVLQATLAGALDAPVNG